MKTNSMIQVLVAVALALVLGGCVKQSSDEVYDPSGALVYSEKNDAFAHTRVQHLGSGYGYGGRHGAYARGGYSYDPRMSMPGYINAPTPAYPSMECYDYWTANAEYVGTTCENDGVIAYVRDGRTFAPGETPAGEESALLRDTAAQTQEIVNYIQRCRKTAGCKVERGGK